MARAYIAASLLTVHDRAVPQLRLRGMPAFRGAGDADVRAMVRLVLKAHRRQQQSTATVEPTAPLLASQRSASTQSSHSAAGQLVPASPPAVAAAGEPQPHHASPAAGDMDDHHDVPAGANPGAAHVGFYHVVRDGHRTRVVLDTSRLPPYGPDRVGTPHVRPWSEETGMWQAHAAPSNLLTLSAIGCCCTLALRWRAACARQALG